MIPCRGKNLEHYFGKGVGGNLKQTFQEKPTRMRLEGATFLESQVYKESFTCFRLLSFMLWYIQLDSRVFHRGMPAGVNFTA